MPTRELLSPAQRAALAAVPELSERDLARHYTLSPEDLAAVARQPGVGPVGGQTGEADRPR